MVVLYCFGECNWSDALLRFVARFLPFLHLLEAEFKMLDFLDSPAKFSPEVTDGSLEFSLALRRLDDGDLALDRHPDQQCCDDQRQPKRGADVELKAGHD